MYLKFWRFYWPLALTGVGLVLAVQFQNATLARYPEAVRELAVLALAVGFYGFFNASIQFLSQLTNVYARSPGGSRKTLQFALFTSGLFALCIVSIAITPFGYALIRGVFAIDEALVEQVTAYLLGFSPLIVLNALRQYLTGLLIQAQRTGWITNANFIYLGIMIGGLIAGLNAGLAPVLVIVGSELIAVLVLIVVLYIAKRRVYALPEQQEHETVTFGELLRFYIPVSTTGVMFALSRPILYAFVARAPSGLVLVAALRVAFDFTTLFQQAANQFRHFFITLGFDDLREKQRFMALIGAGLTLLMLAVALTPLADFIWSDLMAIPPAVVPQATEVLTIMCLMPVAIVYRNYFHSRLMLYRRTAGMAYGAILRVIGIAILSATCFVYGWLDHRSAAAILVVGFFIESFVARLAHNRIARLDRKAIEYR
ncbi:MAG: hypothetical protein AAF513_03490 [Pseudomonadota bacterium]